MTIMNFLKAYIEVKKTEALEHQQIQDLQLTRFRKLLRHVLQNSRFYRRYYHEYGISESDINKLTPQDLPVIDKQTVMENYDDVVCDPALKKEALERFIIESPDPATKYKRVYRVLHTSGSSGTVGLFVYGPRDWAIYQALGGRTAQCKINPLKRRKLALIGLTDGHYAVVTGVLEAPRLMFKVMVKSISNPLEEICRDLNRFRPNNLFGYPSGIGLLAKEQIGGNINIAPDTIGCGGEPLTPAIRKTIEKAFNVNPLDYYGATETLTFSVECRSHHRLHYFDDWFSVQVVDGDLKCVRPGQPGKIIVTNLFNYTQPLIRYQMDDEIVLSDKPCQCGWPFPVIDKIAGRSEESLWFAKTDGNREFIHPSMLGEFFVPGLERFQFVQTKTDRLTMKAIIRDDKEEVISAIHERMAKILTRKELNDAVRFEIKLVDHIKNDPKTGKFRLIIPYTGR